MFPSASRVVSRAGPKQAFARCSRLPLRARLTRTPSIQSSVLPPQGLERVRRSSMGVAAPPSAGGAGGEPDVPRIRVVVRKRPLNQKERTRKEEDIVLVSETDKNVLVNEPKTKVDLTRYTEQHTFTFDDVLDEAVDNEGVYVRTVAPLVGAVLRRQKATCFAYGQTGSGKTYTMQVRFVCFAPLWRLAFIRIFRLPARQRGPASPTK